MGDRWIGEFAAATGTQRARVVTALFESSSWASLGRWMTDEHRYPCTMADTGPLSLVLSAGALAVSATTAWLTLLRPGRLRATRPTLFYFGPDGTAHDHRYRGPLKIYVRTLLYSTSKRGIVVENMYATVRRGDVAQDFNRWVYRHNGQLSRGSGLYVSQEGIALDHHFLLPHGNVEFAFSGGRYVVDVYAVVLGRTKPKLIQSVTAELPDAVASEVDRDSGGIMFNWQPDQANYAIETQPTST